MNHRTVVLIVGAVFGLAGAYFCAGGQRIAAQQTPQGVADALDALIQPRFQIDAGVFGMARIGVPGHDAIVYDNSDKTHFLAKLAAVNHNSKRIATVGFLHCVGKPGKFKPSNGPESPPDIKKLTMAKPSYSMYYVVSDQVYDNGSSGAPSKEAAAWMRKNGAAVEAACLQALASLKQGKRQTAPVGEMLVVMSPVRALHDSCIGCHRGAKRGDTLGAMVYTVGTATNRD